MKQVHNSIHLAFLKSKHILEMLSESLQIIYCSLLSFLFHFKVAFYLTYELTLTRDLPFLLDIGKKSQDGLQNKMA